MPEVAERVDKLEEIVAQTQLMLQSLSYEVSRTQINISNLSQEMKDFKNDIKLDTEKFKIQTQSSIDNLSKELNKKFDKLTKMMGTMVEDIVIPNIEWVAEKYFNLTKGKLLPRAKVYNTDNQQKEFDTVAVYTDKVIWVSAKLTAKNEYAKEFFEEIQAKELFDYFPEYKEKEIIPIFASFHIPENVLTYLTRHKIYAMASKEDTMDILNPELLELK